MFTGIIEDIGRVAAVTSAGSANTSRIALRTSLDTTEIKLGDSISINGVCLTVTGINGDLLTFDASFETLSLSNLRNLSSNTRLNLERAMVASGRFDGHIVTGHIDGVGTLTKKERVGEFFKLRISAGKELLKYIVKKGSVAVDGISLTVNSVDESGFELVIIPLTLEKTVLEFKNIGDKVNLETDILAKYVEKMLNNKGEEKKSKVNAAFLAEHGFM